MLVQSQPLVLPQGRDKALPVTHGRVVAGKLTQLARLPLAPLRSGVRCADRRTSNGREGQPLPFLLPHMLLLLPLVASWGAGNLQLLQAWEQQTHVNGAGPRGAHGTTCTTSASLVESLPHGHRLHHPPSQCCKACPRR